MDTTVMEFTDKPPGRLITPALNKDYPQEWHRQWKTPAGGQPGGVFFMEQTNKKNDNKTGALSSFDYFKSPL